MRQIKRTAAIGAMMACAGLVIGCGGNKTEQATRTKTEGGQTSFAASGEAAASRNMALVRFVNAIPGHSVSVDFGNSQVFTAIDYKTVTPYKELPANKDTFRLTAPNGRETGGAPVASTDEGLNKGVHYTVVAMLDKNGKEKIDVITDNLSQPPAGEASVRVINATPHDVDVQAPAEATSGTASRVRPGRPVSPPPPPNQPRVNGEEGVLFSGVDANTATGFKEITPVDGSFQVLPAGHKQQRKAAGGSVAMQMEPGRLYTLVVAGGTAGQPLDVVQIADNLTTPAASSTNPGATAQPESR
jgi:hypothetical protein